ncbi:dihydroorotase [Jeotgalibacillus haloalkalitolerans]|uniref:Dihydroorotase n=1 Tax=Jeotgalibacillus haloalkalitolerans TaxID=3104292 RepID=A0ABU5KK07_9BACL|nr:dihydroorotase [Jeotgalibacillus sp. HH7-29]MDZ5711589.1 dihydroorotase [Jeotgalibacillus sp. HH7-29]
MNLLIKGADVFGYGVTDVRISDGSIQSIGELSPLHNEEVIEASGKVLSPGFTDVHIHLREPGGEHKETIKTGTQAAARGGYTLVCAMPNTRPVPDDIETLGNIQRKIKEDAVVPVLPYASITQNLAGKEINDLEALAKQGAFAFTDDGVGIQSADQMLQVMERAAKLGKAVVAHCEDNSLIHGGCMHEGKRSEELGLPGIPSVCESVQIARDVLLAEAADCHYHVCHVSTKESVRVIRDAKKAGVKVTAEVTPHHLLLNEEAIPGDDANFKMNPPLRSKEDQQALIEGLEDGTIDFIATDHAPHASKEKAEGMLRAPFGITGLETAFELLNTAFVETGKWTLDQLIEWLAVKPAAVFGLDAGKLSEGVDADLVLLDLTEKSRINPEQFRSKGKNTPFSGQQVTGKVVMTISKGKIVFQEELV